MELLRGERAVAAASALVAGTTPGTGLLVITIDPRARDGGPLQLLALAGPGDNVVVDAAATPELGRVLAQAPRCGAYDAKAVHHALLRTYGAGPRRWACVRVTEQLLLGGRDAPLGLADIAGRYGITIPRADAGLADFAASGRATLQLLDAQIPTIRRDGLAWPSRIEAGAVAPIAAMEHVGMPFDTDAWRALTRATEAELAAVRTELTALFAGFGKADLFGGAAFDLGSDAELKQALSALGYAVADTRRATLAALPAPLGPLLARYRELVKLDSAYGESFLAHVAADGRLHATFEQIGASTGRLSCRAPNLQSIVKDAPHRRCFRAPPGRKLVLGDYATCELRILAEMSGDPVFAEAFARGDDLHARVASRVFGKPVSKNENPELRERAKAVNFGLVYGMGAGGLARTVGVGLSQAEELLRRYFASFPRIKRFLDNTAREALERGFARTLTGRRLYLEPGTDRAHRSAAERVAKNMPIQGTSADITKIALARLHAALAAIPDSALVNTVHDEMVVECPVERADEVATVVGREMRAAGEEILRHIPVVVDVGVSDVWSK